MTVAFRSSQQPPFQSSFFNDDGVATGGFVFDMYCYPFTVIDMKEKKKEKQIVLKKNGMKKKFINLKKYIFVHSYHISSTSSLNAALVVV